MARDRVYINATYRPQIDEMKEKKLLGFNLVENKESFILAVAFGYGKTGAVRNKDGWFLVKNLKTTDKALLASILLGTVEDDSEVDQLADIEKALDLCEEYAEHGFEEIRKRVVEAGKDKDTLNQNLMEELDLLYKKNVEES